MKTFTDRNGTVRTLDLHMIKLGEISEALGVKIYDVQQLATISDDVIQQCKLLWLSSDASESFEAFTQTLTLQSIEDGMDAFIEELCEVLPSRHTAVLKASHEKSKALRAELTTTAVSLLQ